MRGQVKVYQKKIVARRRRRAFLVSLYCALFIGLIVSGLSYLSHLDAFAVERVAVTGNMRLSAGEVESIVREKAAGNYLGLFSKQNSFLYPEGEVAAALSALPLVKGVDVSRDGLHAISIAISERSEEAIWCVDGEGSRCFSLDENGLAFALRESVSTDDFVYRGRMTEASLGENFLPAPEFKKMQFFMSQLAGLSVAPREAAIDETGYMTVSLSGGGRIIVNTQDDLSEVLGNVATIVSDKSVASSFSEFLSTLDYLKLDSGNKAVYKRKD